MMKIARIVAPALITAAATLIPLKLANAACEMVETPRGPQLRCSLSELLKGRDDLKISIDPNPSRLPLPNLVVKDLDDGLSGNSVQVGVEVENRGRLSAGQFNVIVQTSVKDPFQIAPSNTSIFLANPVPGLGVGATFSFPAGSVNLPNNLQDWDVCTLATADSVPFAPNLSGDVLESDETDNMKEKCCRVYGNKAAPNDPGPC